MDDMTAIRADLISQQIAREGKKKMSETVYTLWDDEIDKDTEEPTGQIQVKFKHYAKGFNPKTNSAWDIKPAVFDSLGKPVPDEIRTTKMIGRGSIVKVSYDMVAYTFGGQVGARFELRATQLVKPIFFSGDSRADSFEGDVEEDGFVVEEVEF
jgi:hypothetical protein